MTVLNVREARGFWERGIGMIGWKEAADSNMGLLIRTRWGIHTFGMRSSIDVIVLDGQNRVVGIKADLKPGRLFFWNPVHDRVVEMPAGAAGKNKIEKEEKIDLRVVSYL